MQYAKLPPRIRLAEGNLYDIMTMKPKNTEELMHYDYKNDNKFRSTKDAMERDIRKRCENKYDLGETRKLNRVTSETFEEMTANGFDLVTGQSFYGEKAKPLYRPTYMQKPPTVWDKVETTKTTKTGLERYFRLNIRINISYDRCDVNEQHLLGFIKKSREGDE